MRFRTYENTDLTVSEVELVELNLGALRFSISDRLAEG